VAKSNEIKLDRRDMRKLEMAAKGGNLAMAEVVANLSGQIVGLHEQILNLTEQLVLTQNSFSKQLTDVQSQLTQHLANHSVKVCCCNAKDDLK
jgi:hypothetical protein